MARCMDKLYDTTSSAGAALDTGVLKTAGYEYLYGHYFANGGSPTACQAFIEDPALPGVAASTIAAGATVTPSGVAVPLFCWGPNVSGGSGPMSAPVPPGVRFTIGAIVSQTVRFILWGVKPNTGN